MATGGSGDVLAGIIGGMLAACRLEDSDPFRAAALGVLIHGRCGDDAAARLGEYSVMASDLIDSLPTVLRDMATSL
jgi:NAD(P)H-hydrate epimerase